MTISRLAKAPSAPSARRGRPRQSKVDPTWIFLRVYVGCVAACLLSMVFIPITPVVYLACGWCATRVISANVTWSPLEGTVHNVGKAKGEMLLGWLWRMPPLIGDYLKARYL